MRIELPSASWADTVQRAEEDAHTLTIATQSAADRPGGNWRAETGVALHTEVVDTEPVVVTITF